MDMQNSGGAKCSGGSCGSGKMCGCMCHKAVPVLVILLALLFLGKAMMLLSDSTVAYTWPVLLLLGGLSKLCKGMCKCC